MFVSLSGPLDPLQEDDVSDELREWGEVYHHAPVYRAKRDRREWREEGRARDRQRDSESYTTQR